MSKATFYIRILNLRNVKKRYKCGMASGVGTQAANYEAPERTSLNFWRFHPLKKSPRLIVIRRLMPKFVKIY